MEIRYLTFSEGGPRDKNEDYIICHNEGEPSIFVLCDGMGGHDNGEGASKLVAETVVDTFIGLPPSMDLAERVSASCEKAKFEIDKHLEMGTTAAIVTIADNEAVFVHCGDSRIYQCRDGRIIFQSVDHVAISPSGSPVITRAFFPNTVNYRPDIESVSIEIGDKILICSDGVFGEGKWSDLHDVLRRAAFTIQDVLEIASCNAHDNFSAILIDVVQ